MARLYKKLVKYVPVRTKKKSRKSYKSKKSLYSRGKPKRRY